MITKLLKLCNPKIFSLFQFWLSVIGMVGLTVTSLAVAPPSRLPDLFPVLVSAYSCGHFVIFLLCFHWLQFTCDDSELGESLLTGKSEASSAKSSHKNLTESKRERKQIKAKMS